MNDTIDLVDVYDERPESERHSLRLWIMPDHDGGIIVSDEHPPNADTGSFNFLLENRYGESFFVYWHENDFGNDPTFTINLDRGRLE